MRLSWSPGVRAFSASATSTYPAYGVIMKQVWVNRSTCSCTAATTWGAALPTVVTAIPEPKSISELPSASTTTPPPAATANTGIVTDTAVRHRGLPPRRPLPRDRPGDLGDEPPLLGQRRPALHLDCGHASPTALITCLTRV